MVRNLAVLNGMIAVGLIAYAYRIGLPFAELVPLVLMCLLATVPVALPATFTLSTALDAQALARQGVLPTRLSATVAALKSRLALWASALRDGVWTTVPAATLVPGDVIKLSLGTPVLEIHERIRARH